MDVIHVRNLRRRTKAKTGCTTCRKVKCDEHKPFCRKCVSTGRICNGFASPFRIVTPQSIKNGRTIENKHDARLKPSVSILTEITPEDIDLLNRYFSTKTMFDVKLSCDEEAKQILEASLTDMPLRHAVQSLRALREDLEMSGVGTAPIAPLNINYEYGMQQYCVALAGLASNLSSLNTKELKSALYCCQIFISIEQARWNFADMARHIIRGLKIMHEYRAKPCFEGADRLMPASHDELPSLDIFVIKLLAAPCNFAVPPATGSGYGTVFPGYARLPHPHPLAFVSLRPIALNMRIELTRIADSTIHLLRKVSQIESVEGALTLLVERAALLHCLDSWLSNVELLHEESQPQGFEHIAVDFMRFFHQILEVILLGLLDSSSKLTVDLETANDRLQILANLVGDRIKAYRMCNKSSS